MDIVMVEQYMINDIVETQDDRFLYETSLITHGRVARIYIGMYTGSTMVIWIPDGGGFYGDTEQ